jgi:hypothetical protein
MTQDRRDNSLRRASAVMLAALLLAGGAGCGGGVAPGGPGGTDAGGGDAMDGTVDGPTCPALGCNPYCPNGVLKDQNGCDTCQCAPADAGGTACMTDGDCPTEEICGFLESAGCAATGQCFAAPGARCAIPSSVGCGCNAMEVSIDPSCYSGLPDGYQLHPVRHEGACAADAGDVCVSDLGGPCGGNRANPCTCAPDLKCTPGDSGLPFGDVGGTCE